MDINRGRDRAVAFTPFSEAIVKHASLAFFFVSVTFALGLTFGGSPLATVTVHAQGGDQAGAAASYTEEQSTRGEALYKKACSFCHADASMAPLLSGDVFLSNWSDQTAASLLDKIQQTMPANEPGTLTAPQSADLVAYILKLNRVPVGQTPLPTDAAALATLKLPLK